MRRDESIECQEAFEKIDACWNQGEKGKVLDLSGLQLSELPDEICQLTALEELYIEGNQISILPLRIFELTRLRVLRVSNNDLKWLAGEIGQLTALKVLDLSHNKIDVLPCQIGDLASLQILNLGNNNLKEIPENVGQLNELVELRLDENIIESMPENIGRLSKLKSFSIAGNKLTVLTSHVGGIESLKALDISRNKLVSLPEKIGCLINLVDLNASGNQIRTLPDQIGGLASLTGLNLSSNQLISLPSTIGQLKLLKVMLFSNNCIGKLPDEIGNIISLRELDLSNNRLTGLPEEIGRLTALDRLFLHDNPALDLPNEVLGVLADDVWKARWNKHTSPKSILDHYFARQRQGERPLNEVRLVLVGRGGSGKTSLVRQLVNGLFNPIEKETQGIALSDWVMRGCHGDPVTAHVWDFAGQVITHSMHRYFLSHRTVYLLVLTQREDMAGEDAEYWLKLIESYGTENHADGSKTSPPVLAALNKSNHATVRVDRGALRERYPSIIDFIETDCEDGRGIEALRSTLCQLMDEPQVKPWVRQPYPKKWWDVKEAIRRVQQDRPHVSYDEWRAICSQCDVVEHSDQDAASRDLHTLGVALNYADDERLHDNTVLRPNWVTHHCYNLIRHAQKNGGDLRHDELKFVLGSGENGEADHRMHDYLMRLMERFEAAYPVGDSWPPERWLVPLGLPDSQPDGVEMFGKVKPEEATRLTYRYSSIPPGLLAQFMVRTSDLAEPQMQWANGTVIALNGARALVRAVSKTEVEITAINGAVDALRDLSGLCREELMDLNAQISGLEVKEKTQAIAEGEVVWASVRALEQDELKGKLQSGVATDQGTLEVETKKELDEFGTEESRLPEEDRDPFERTVNEAVDRVVRRKVVVRSKPKPRIFISYSHQDERHRKTLELHLEVLKINGLVHKVWHDRRIQPGMDWDKKIQAELAEADVILFLTSTAALASGYINEEELRPALERHAKEEAVIVPIILERCAWEDTFAASPPLKKLQEPRRRVPQGLPRDGKPLISFNPRSTGWHQVAEGLKTLLTEVKARLSR